MKVACIVTTMYSGGQERLANILTRYTTHEAKVLAPGVWTTARYKGDVFREDWDNHENIYWISKPEYRDMVLDWADVWHFFYPCSIATIGRPDLIGKKPTFWHLALRWTDEFLRFFPNDSVKKTRFILSCEGWERYEIPDFDWKLVPVLFPIEDELYRPIPFDQRESHAAMSPRLLHNLDWSPTERRYIEIKAPRSARKIERILEGLPFDLIAKRGFTVAMNRKKRAWVGIDDVMNSLCHLSGFEFLSCGVPCINRIDDFLRSRFSQGLGIDPPPFIRATLDNVREVVEKLLLTPIDVWEQRCREAREWMERNYHPRDTIRRYVELYEKG